MLRQRLLPAVTVRHDGVHIDALILLLVQEFSGYTPLVDAVEIVCGIQLSNEPCDLPSSGPVLLLISLLIVIIFEASFYVTNRF